jgi:signal transduction histidine kinase
VSQSGVAEHYRFRFEAENRFCLAGYGATVLMLCVVYGFQIEPITLKNLTIYALITLGFHLSVQAFGLAGLLASKKRTIAVTQIAMVNWAISFTYICFFISELRPILLLGSFLTLNFYVGRGDFRQSLGLSCLIPIFYLSPAFQAQMTDGFYAHWARDGICLMAFVISSLHASTVARHNGKLRKEVYQAKLAADQANEELKRSSESAIRKAFDKVEKANQVKGELLANLSHEFRTPLNAIINVPDILKENLGETPCWLCESCGASFNDPDLLDSCVDVQAEECPDCKVPMDLAYRAQAVTSFAPSQLLNRSQQAGHYLLYCFDNIMNLSLLEAKELVLDPVDARLDELLEDVVMMFKQRTQYRERVLRMEVKTTRVRAHCDPERVREVLAHLVDNALRFSSAGDEVVVRLEDGAASQVRLSVIDTGLGIATDAQHAIFESFQQADSSHTRDHAGLGLGLTLALGLIELHGSKLEFESEIDRGSDFSFELPTVDS